MARFHPKFAKMLSAAKTAAAACAADSAAFRFMLSAA